MADFWSSVGDIFGNVVKGAMKSLEGIYDFHAGTVGLVGGWFDDEFKKDVREHITYDWAEDNTKWVKELEHDSVFGDTVHNIAGGVGGMLPSVVLSFVPYAGAALSTGALMMGAAGNSMESSLKEGAGYGNAFVYGVGKGVVEGATEKLGGFVLGKGGSVLGKATAGTSFGNAVSKGVGKVAFDAASEGAEEVISDLADPALKYVTGVDDNIGENYGEAFKGLPKTFVEGATVGSIMQGGTTGITNIVNKAKGRGGAKATRADNAMQNILEATKNYTGVQNKDIKYDNAVKFNLKTVSSELVKMSPEARKNYLDSIGVYKNAFDRETGRLQENSMPYAHREAITANLRMFSGNLNHKPTGGENITNGAKMAKKTVERVVGHGAAVVVTNELGAEDRAIYNPDDGVIYINNNADLTEKDVANMVALHEIAHATEGTKAYARLIETLENMMYDPNAPQAIKDIVGNVEARRSGIKKDYAEQLGKMSDQYQKGYLVQSELHADLVGELLGNDYFIEKLAERDMGLLEKLYHSFKNRTIKKNSELGPDGIKYLKKLASKFGAAIEKRAGGVKIFQIGDEKEEKEKGQEAVVSNARADDERKSTVKYDYSKSFAEQIEDYKSNKFPQNDTFVVGKTPDVLVKIGLSELPMTINQEHVDYALNGTKNSEHHIGDMIKQLPTALENPVAVISSKTSPNTSVVVIISLKHQNNQIIAPVYVSGSGRTNGLSIDSNSVTSVHGRKNAITGLLQSAVTEEANGQVGVFYWNKKEASKLMTSQGVTMPQGLSLADGFIHSIHEKGSHVNINVKKITETKQFKRFFGDWQNKPQSASKIVNDDGTPRIVYHQTDADITTFYTSAEGAGARDNTLPHGIYMKPTPFDIGLKGKKQMKLYASIKTPLVFDTRETAQRYWKKNIPGYDAILDEIAENDAKYNEEFENTFDAASEDDSAAETILAEWEEKNTVLDKKAKSLIDTYLENSRFDGIILEKDVGSMGRTVTTYIALKPEQVKSATDNIGTFDRDNPDIRYSKKRSDDSKTDSETDYFEEYMKEFNENLKANHEKRKLKAENSRLRRFIANNVNQKVYSVSHSKEAISDILNGAYFGGYDAKIQGSKLKGIERELYDALNFTEKDKGAKALDIAEHIVLNTMLIEQVEMTEELELAQRIVTALKPYLHQMNVESIREDIKATFDDDKTPFVLWAVHQNSPFRGYTADEVAQELEAEGITISGERGRILNEADLFIKIHEMWTESRRIITEAVPDKATLLEMLNEDEVKRIKQEIAKDLLRAYDKYGNKTKISKIEQRYKNRLSNLSKRFKEQSDIVNVKNQMLEVIKRIENSKSGLYANATQEHSRALKDWKKLLCDINSREMINRTSLVKILKRLNVLYEKETPVLDGFYSAQVKEILTYFSLMEESTKTSELELVELRFILDVLKHMDFFFNSFDKIWKNGRYVELADVAKEQNERLDDAIKYKTNALINLAGEKLGKNMLDPQSVFAGLDAYDENGFFSTTFREIRYGLIECKANQVKALEELDDFREKNKKYFKQLLSDKNTVTVSFTVIRDEDGLPLVKDIEIPVYAAIDLYMTSRTGKDALETLEETGFFLKRDNSKKSERMGTVTKEQLDMLYDSFSEQDKELIEILRKQYNGFLQQLKIDTDFKRFGFSNVISGEYYPLRRYVAESSEEPDNFFNEVDRVLNSPFNNSRVKGTKNALLIGNALTKFMRHVEGVTKYASLAIPIENANRIKNADVGGNLRMPKSILTTFKENPQFSWANSYLDNFIADIQGITIRMDDGQKLIGKLRGAFATYQLGFNPKVWLTQISSYLAAFGELRLSSLLKAITIKGSIKDSEVDKYCELAKIRHYEKGVTKASTVSEKLGRFGNITTAVVEKVDRGVIKMLFAACQAEAKSRYGLEIGSEANKIKAGEILTDVILNSQQNQLFSEYSAMMRSKSDIVKSFTMFGADSMKLLSRFFENLGRVITLSRKMKAYEKGSDAYNSLKAQRNRAALKLAKYSAAIAAVSAFMAAIAKLFKHLYNKDDEEETIGEWLGIGTVDNILGMAPVFRDLYSLFREGYEVDTFATSMINDVGTSFKSLIDNTVSSIQGKDVGQTEWLATAKKLVFALGQLTGVPTRNVYNFTVGMTRRFDEGTGKSIDAWFKAPSESDAKASIREGIEDMDGSLTEYGLNQIYKKYEIEASDKALKSEFDRLLKLNATKDEDDNTDYSPLGFKIPENLEIDGEDVELSAEDRKVFKNGLNSAEKSSAAMVKTYYYRQLGDKYKAYAIRKVFEYYDLVAREAVGAASEERASVLYYGEAVGIDVLAVLMAYKQELNGASDAEKAKRGKSTKELIIEYLKRFNLTPVQKSLVLRALGYSDKDNDKLVKAFIERRPGLSREQRAEFTQIAKCDL